MRRWLLAASAVLALITQAAPSQAAILLGGAADYGVLIEPNASSFQLNNSTIFANVGLGTGVTNVQIASNGFIKAVPGFTAPPTGRLDIVNASFAISNSGNVAGGVFFNQSQVTTAINTVNSLNSTFGAEAGSPLIINGGGQIVNASTGALDAFGNRVFTINPNAFTNDNQGFTVVGTASDYAIFNINNGVSNEAFGGPISLSGGITPDHVLFNFVGTSGNLGASAGGATVNGIFLAPQMKINLDNVTINGRLFGGRAGQDFQTVSGFKLNQQSVPEPASVLLLGFVGLGASAIRRPRVR